MDRGRGDARRSALEHRRQGTHRSEGADDKLIPTLIGALRRGCVAVGPAGSLQAVLRGALPAAHRGAASAAADKARLPAARGPLRRSRRPRPEGPRRRPGDARRGRASADADTPRRPGRAGDAGPEPVVRELAPAADAPPPRVPSNLKTSSTTWSSHLGGLHRRRRCDGECALTWVSPLRTKYCSPVARGGTPSSTRRRNSRGCSRPPRATAGRTVALFDRAVSAALDTLASARPPVRRRPHRRRPDPRRGAVRARRRADRALFC